MEEHEEHKEHKEYNIDTILEKLFDKIDSEELIVDEKFQQKVERILNLQDVFDMLDKTQQNRVTIKEIIAEQSPDFVASCKELKTVFARELNTKATYLSNIHESEISRLQGLLKSNLMGKGLKSILEAVYPDWTFLFRLDKTILYKCYNPCKSLNQGFIDDNLIQYDEEIFNLQGIYVNVMNDKVTSDTIHLAGTGHHPAVEDEGYGSACPGTLEGEEISLTNPEALRKLLDTICEVYEMMHIDTGYYEPNTHYEIIEKRTVWDSRRNQ